LKEKISSCQKGI